MLVYDVTNEKSFDNIKNWIRNIEENASADVEKMLLGNKCELSSGRQVSIVNTYNCRPNTVVNVNKLVDIFSFDIIRFFTTGCVDFFFFQYLFRVLKLKNVISHNSSITTYIILLSI